MTGKERADETFRSKESRKKTDDLYPLFSLGTGGGMPGDLRLCPAVEQKSNGARPDIPLSRNKVSTIELVERRSGKKTVVQDEETLAWAIDALNAYRYSYVFFFDKERADPEGGFELRIHNGWQWESYIFAREGFLIDGLWYGGDSITLSELSSLVTS